MLRRRESGRDAQRGAISRAWSQSGVDLLHGVEYNHLQNTDVVTLKLLPGTGKKGGIDEKQQF